ncbi:MAG: GPW/gp25 family protein [Sphingobium sp.]|uniref:GPW/gp25 family protein n=1 Tax=Sphingobium sp. TaxID=1912891 RepID=UPI003BAE9E10
MIGIDRHTGKRLSGRAHLEQSIGDILSTGIGLRTMLRDYGAAMLGLVDQPGNGLGRARLRASVAVALARWEPRLRLTRVDVTPTAGGRAIVDIEGQDLENPQPNSLVRLSIPIILAAA